MELSFLLWVTHNAFLRKQIVFDLNSSRYKWKGGGTFNKQLAKSQLKVCLPMILRSQQPDSPAPILSFAILHAQNLD